MGEKTVTRIEKIFPLDHPTGPGHFPGNPIIPGAVLLAEVIRAIEIAQGADLLQCQIKSAKFSFPARPGDHLIIEFSEVMKLEIKFQCTVQEKTVLTGAIKCAAPSITP